MRDRGKLGGKVGCEEERKEDRRRQTGNDTLKKRRGRGEEEERTRGEVNVGERGKRGGRRTRGSDDGEKLGSEEREEFFFPFSLHKQSSTGEHESLELNAAQYCTEIEIPPSPHPKHTISQHFVLFI